MALKNKLPERYPEMIGMYAKGEANSLDILRTDFGHWPPNGLDIVRPPDFDIKFKSIFGTFAGLSRFFPSLTSAFLTAQLSKSSPISAAIFFAIATAARVMALGGFVKKKEPTIFLNDGYRLLGRFQGGRRYLSHIISHEFKHVLQGRDSIESLSSSINGDRKDIASMLEEDVSEHKKYLAEECEIQARLHTVIVGAYHQFERMPTNYEELIAALHSQGVKIPDIALRHARSTLQGRQAFSFYVKDDELHDRYADKSAIGDLNSVLEAVRQEHQKQFSAEILPFIYGDLLELYGDRYGAKRMGHTHNVQLREVFYKMAENVQSATRAHRRKTIVTKEELAGVKRDFATAMDTIDKMAKDDAVDLGCMIIRGDVYSELGGMGCVTLKDSTGIGRAAVERIAARSDLTTSDKKALRYAYALAHTPGRRYKPEVLSSGMGPNEPKRRTTSGGYRAYEVAA